MKKLTKSLGTLCLLGCAVVASPYAIAGDSGWYLGGNLGQSRANIDDARITSGLLGAGLTTTSITDNNNDTGHKLFGGYQFNKNFALEGGYFNLGQYSFTSTTTAPGTLNGKIKIDGLNLDAVGILPITEKFSAFGRIGLNYADSKDNFTSTGSVTITTNPNPSKHEINPKLGIGLQYNFTEPLAMRVEAERYRINDAVGNKGDVDLVSVGLIYRFGVKKPAPQPAAKIELPEPVIAPAQLIAATPPPAPEPRPIIIAAVAPPPKIIHRMVTFSADSSADSLFDFGKSTVKPAGQQALNKFADGLKGAQFDFITVTGNTDRIGSRAYNLKLSQRRADEVKNYLVASSGIPSDKITAKGVGESFPVTKQGECKNKLGNRKLIACLGPDRRVDVVVAATRTSDEIATLQPSK